MSIAYKIKEKLSVTNTGFIVSLGIGLLAFLLFSLIISRLIYPFDLGHYEAFNWMPAQNLLDGKNPYSYAFTPPYSMSPYGIIFYALLAAGLKFFGFQLWFGRVLSVLAYAICIFITFKITEKITHHKETALVAVLAALAMFPGQFWIGMIRPDLIGLAFSLTGIWIVLRFEEGEKINFVSLLSLSLLACSAFFTKQTFLLPIAIIFSRLLQLRKWDEAFVFMAGCLILMTGSMFFLNYTSDGGYFWQHFSHAKTLSFTLNHSFDGLLTFLELPVSLLFGVFLLVFAYLSPQFFNQPRDELSSAFWRSPKFLIFSYFLLSFSSSLISIGRVGANINYFLECSFLMAIICGFIYQNFREQARPQLAGAFLILLILGGVFQLTRVIRGEYFRWQAVNYYREIFETAGKFISPGGSCLSVYPELVIPHGCSFNFDDIGEYTSGWSPKLNEIFKNEVQTGKYAVIILHDDKFQETFPNYRLVPMIREPPDKFYPVYLYVRKTDQFQ